eukprot:6392811-Prymnesium_polylepis.1
MRLLKLFAWEASLMRELQAKREEELVQVKKNSLLGGAISFFFTSVPIFVTLATFLVYSALGNKLTAATAFTSLSLFQIIRFPLLIVPMIITRLIDISVVNKRLSRFLNAPGRETKQLDDVPPDGGTAAADAPHPPGVQPL